MSSETVFRTHYDHERAARSVVFKASVDTKQLTSTALLSYPEKDLAGDVVVPEGISLYAHMRDPRVDFEHRRDPAVRDAVVGWAHSGYGDDDRGEYTVKAVMLNCDGRKRPLPVATTYFDPSDRLQYQMFTMVAQELLPAVSLEFSPDMTAAKSLGKSPLEPRDAYEFGRVSVLRYTLCERGVCESATVLKAFDPLRSVLSANRIGGEELHPTIRKAFAHKVPGKPAVVTSGFTPPPVEKSAMDPNAMAPAGDAAPAPDDSTDTTAGAGGNGITQLYDYAQQCQDMAEAMKAGETDNPAILKDFVKFAETMAALAEKLLAAGDKHDSALQAAKGTTTQDDADAKASDDYEPGTDTDDDGNLKAIPPKYAAVVKALRAARFSLADVQKAEREQAAPAKAAEPVEPGDSPEDVAELEKQVRLFEKEKLLYGAA